MDKRYAVIKYPSIFVTILIVLHILGSTFMQIGPQFTYENFALSYQNMFVNYRFWTILSFQFINSNIVSLIFSCIILWQLGTDIEKYVGSIRMIMIYSLGVICNGLIIIQIEQLTYFFTNSPALLFILVLYTFLFRDKYLGKQWIKIKYFLYLIIILYVLLHSNTRILFLFITIVLSMIFMLLLRKTIKRDLLNKLKKII